METELELFLIEREAVSETVLGEMKSEKIDMAAIVEMDQSQLSKFIPKVGDMLAVLRFCKSKYLQSNHTERDRNSLVERIKKSQQVNLSNMEKNLEAKVPSKKNPHEKSTRQIAVGWLMNGKQVREKGGGGIRNVSIQKTCKKADVLKIAVSFYFPDGESSKKYGPLSKFTYDLLDYKMNEFDDSLTVGDMYKLTGLNRLRFYLSTSKIDNDSSSDPEKTNTKRLRKSTRQTKKKCLEEKQQHLLTEEAIQDQKRKSGEKDDENIFNAIDLDEVKQHFNEFRADLEYESLVHSLNENDDLRVNSVVNEIVESQFETINEIFNETINEFSVRPNENQNLVNNEPRNRCAESLSSCRTLTLHRGQIFGEMTKEFEAIENMSTFIFIEIIGTNGKKENALDGGGVFLDALTEYWNEFYDRMCVGSTMKVPEVNYMIDNCTWKAMAKILLIGYKQVHYFPIKISQPFLECAVFGQPFSDLSNAYMQYISPLDADVVNRAMTNFESVDFADLMETLTNLESKQIVNSVNIKEVVQRLARAELTQKTRHVSEIWASVLENTFTLKELSNIYLKSDVSNRAVLHLIKDYGFVESADARKEKLLNFIKRFVREAEIDLLKKFLRFCTGADIITCDAIIIEFADQATPTAHTCNNIFVMPLKYELYREFRSEFTNILMANMWRMDIL